MSTQSASEQVRQAVLAWEGMTAHPHRFDGFGRVLVVSDPLHMRRAMTMAA